MANTQISLVMDKALLEALDATRRKEMNTTTRQSFIRQAIAELIKQKQRNASAQ